jgi:hypothetical protein
MLMGSKRVSKLTITQVRQLRPTSALRYGRDTFTNLTYPKAATAQSRGR